MRFHRILIPLAIALLTNGASAQLPTVDITLVDGGDGNLEVRLRPNGSFNGLFSSLVFTIRWSAASGATLGAVSQTLPVIQYIPTAKSGGEIDDAGNRYQVFAGFGMVPLSAVGQSWPATASEFTLMTVPVNGSATFEIVNDTWTATNNGNFYVALNGSDKTGVIYATGNGFPAIDGSAPGLVVLPNPGDGGSTVWLRLKSATSATIEVLNTAGQVVWQRSYENVASVRESVDLRTHGAGSYVVRATAGDVRYTEQVVIR